MMFDWPFQKVRCKDGYELLAHKLILATCSPYLKTVSWESKNNCSEENIFKAVFFLHTSCLKLPSLMTSLQ